MGIKKYIKRYTNYESKVLSNRKSIILSNMEQRRKSKEELERIRRNAFMEEAKKQAAVRGKMMARRKYSRGYSRLESINRALGNTYNVATPKKTIVKKRKKKSQTKRRRTVIKYVYR